MENHQSSAAPPNNGKGDGSGCPEKNKQDVAVPNLISSVEKNKDVAVPNFGKAAVAAATVVTSNDDVSNSKGKSVAAAAADDKEPPHVAAERLRRNRMKDYFAELQTLVPQIPEKTDKYTTVGYVIDYIRSLEKTKADLEKRKQDLALARARQAGVDATTSSSSAPPPATAHGMAALAPAMSSDVIVPDGSDHNAVPPPPPPPPLQAPVPLAAAVPVPVPVPVPPQPQVPMVAPVAAGFKTWAWPDIVLSVSNGNAYISVCAPRPHGMRTLVMVLSVLDKYGIDLVTAQIDANDVRSVFNILARVTAMGGDISWAEEVYKLAVSEILVWLNPS